MHKMSILLLIILPIRLLLAAVEIEIIADVNGEPISNLDIEKRVNLVNSFPNSQNGKKLKLQILSQIIDEFLILNEAKRLNIKLSDKELNDAVESFLARNFKIKVNEIANHINKYAVYLNVLKEQIKCQLLWSKIIEIRIIPFINISNIEINDVKAQIEKPDYIVTFQEFIINSKQDNESVYNIAKNLAKKLRDSDNNFIPEFPIKMRETTVNLNQLEGNLRNTLEGLEASDIAGPFSLLSEGYSIIKVIDKVELNHELLESTLRLKHVIAKNSKTLSDNLKKQKVNCLNFDKVTNNLKLENVKEFEIKMRDLNPGLQALLSKKEVNKLVEFRENGATRLIMLCDIKSNSVGTEEAIKQQIYQQKVMTQSNLLLDNIRKNAAVNYQYNFNLE